ncbi:MAG TPA: glutamate-cysteine ligase family protein [Polyangia bacterium]
MSLSVDELVAYFCAGAKPRAQFRIGIEQEKIGARRSGAPVCYQGSDGIAEVLARLEKRGFAATREGEHIIALEREGERITIEPGGQLEFSGAARATAAACRDALDAHVREVIDLARPLDIHWLGVGGRPFGKLDDVDWLPKARYGVMREYFPRHGRSSRLAHHMMKMTATVQANFDYESEADAVDKIRTAYGVSSIVTGLFAASPIADGRPTGDKSSRAAIWLETDEDRCGLLPFVFEPGFGFRDYVEWALDVPMFFVVRDGHYRPVDAMTFRRFIAEGAGGETATLRDWEIHLSTLFPEVRLKRYIELRGADAGPMPMAVALGALWRGLLDDRDARIAAWELVANHSFAEREALRREVPRAALQARLGGRRLHELALELTRIADAGLARLSGGEDDRPLLAPLWGYASAGRTPADDMLDDFKAAGGDPARLVAKWELRL